MVKRILAALLTIAMLLSVCSVEAFAAENSGSDLWWQYPSEDSGTTETPETTEDPETCAHDGEFIYEYDWNYFLGTAKAAHNKICAKCGSIVEKDIECEIEVTRALPINEETLKVLEAEGHDYNYDIDESHYIHYAEAKCKYCNFMNIGMFPHDLIDNVKIDYENTETGHIVTRSGTCSVCGDYTSLSSTIVSPHSYNSVTGKCVCGKEKPDCDHASKKAVEIDDSYHNIVCADKCGEIQSIEEHTYKDSICTECGHKCTHELNHGIFGDVYYRDNGDGTHSVLQDGSFTCDNCGFEYEETIEYVDKHYSYYQMCICGYIKPSEGIPAASVDYDTLEALKDEFLEEYNSDMVNLIIEDASDTVSDEDKKLVELDTNYTVGLYLNIELENWNGPVTETKTMIPITIAIPEEYLATGRTFSIVRVHDGIVTVLKDEDSDPRTITFSTNQFSTYAIVYKDTVAVEEQEDKGTSVGRTPDMPTAPFGAYVVDMGDNHGIIYGGHIISMPHTYNAAGVCTSCGHER